MLRMLRSKIPTNIHTNLYLASNSRMPVTSSVISPVAQSFSSTAASAWQASPPGRPRIIIITGPTAVGKTKLGLELAKRLDGEIISADSVQVYKGLDVGSDKLPVEQREGVPHHLIDILPPDAEFSAGDFHHLGRTAAADIIARGKVPIVVGGTGFYLRWFIFGKAQTPPSNPQTAARAQELIEQAWQKAAAALTNGQQQQQQLENEQTQQQQHQQQEQQRKPLLQQLQHNLQQLVMHAWQKAAAALGAKQQQFKRIEQQRHHQRQRQQQQQQGDQQSIQQVLDLQQDLLQQRHQQQQQPSSDQQNPAAVPAQLHTPGLPHLQPAAAAAAAATLTDDQRWHVAVDVVAELGDPVTAARIRAERNNWYRLQRVLQILIQNGGKPLSELDVNTTKPLHYDFRCFFLHRNRIELYDRICYRVEQMVESGLLQEALMLLDMGMTPNSHIATKAIGYRQACTFMQTALAEGQATKQQLQQMILDIATASRNLVKNQTTWFRDDDLFRWLEVGGRDTDDVVQELLTELDKPQHEGGCGDSGRLDKELKNALKRYVPTLKIFNDDRKCMEVLQWVNEVSASRQQQEQEQQQQQERQR